MKSEKLRANPPAIMLYLLDCTTQTEQYAPCPAWPPTGPSPHPLRSLDREPIHFLQLIKIKSTSNTAIEFRI